MMFNIRPVLIACIFYLLVTTLLNYQILCNALFNCSRSHPSDGIITEYITESTLQKIAHGENPFSFDQKLFYPFYTTYAMADPGNSQLPIYALFRAVSPSHNALLLVVFVYLFLNYLVMYMLLRTLKMDFWVALLGGFVFGAMPFVSYRVLNHYTYTPLFVFPLLFLWLYSLFTTPIRKIKLLYAALIGLLGTYILLTNFYYFISIGIAIGALFVCASAFHRKQLWDLFKNNILYLLLSGVIFIALLFPWLMSVKTIGKLYTNSEMQGFGGAWLLSSDLLNVFLPSQHNPLYAFIFSKLSTTHTLFQKLHTMFLAAYAKNAYAGILLLCTLVGAVIGWKKIPKQVRSVVFMYITVALFFLSLSFGPFLQVFNRWFMTIEGVMVVLPMPFLLLHYTPGMETLRAPSRFIPLYIFFLVLASSYIWNYLYAKLPTGKLKYRVIGIIFFVVLIDQMYLMPPPATEYATHIPTKLYDIIAKDQQQSTVLEIPFTVRDGFTYKGNVKAVTPMKGAITHGKPIIGGYIARVATEIFSYYDNLPFISYVASTIDVGNADDGQPVPKKIIDYKGNTESIKEELNFLNVKHIILKQDEQYSKILEKNILAAGFKKASTDTSYALYSRSLPHKEFTRVDFTKANNLRYYQGSRDDDTKMPGLQFSKFAKLFVHTEKQKKELVIQAVSNKEMMVDVYINSQYLNSITITPSKKSHTMPIDIRSPVGVQMLDIVLKDSSSGIQATLYTVEVR